MHAADPNVSFRAAYGVALGADPERLHFAAHSHHLWPDCTREAQLAAWQDSATLADLKWDRVFDHAILPAKQNIARLLGGVAASQIALGANTHEFVVRLFSCFEKPRVRVLTTDGEFHSLRRQLERWEEAGWCEVRRVSVEPFESFPERWAQAAHAAPHDIAFLSQVFFNSGHTIDLTAIVNATPRTTGLVIDGYHAFCALPVDITPWADRLFYLGGGYKYAQAGEGICFLYVPTGCELRPLNTGWFADFAGLDSPRPGVGYALGGDRFAGATLDFTAAYRFNAVQDWWKRAGIDVSAIHARVQQLKTQFVEGLAAKGGALNAQWILRDRGCLPDAHFVVFQTPEAGAWVEKLAARGIIVDRRADRLRFGFGLYHDTETVDRLLARLA